MGFPETAGLVVSNCWKEIKICEWVKTPHLRRARLCRKVGDVTAETTTCSVRLYTHCVFYTLLNSHKRTKKNVSCGILNVFIVFSVSLTLKLFSLSKVTCWALPFPTCPFSPPVWTAMSIPTLPRIAKRRRTAPRKSVSSTTKMPSWRRVKWWWPLPLPPPVPPPLSSRVIITSTFLNDPFFMCLGYTFAFMC